MLGHFPEFLKIIKNYLSYFWYILLIYKIYMVLLLSDTFFCYNIVNNTNIIQPLYREIKQVDTNLVNIIYVFLCKQKEDKMRTYLIDFENTKSTGLKGIDKLEVGDIVYLFYSNNVDSITMEAHMNIVESKAEFKPIKLDKPGKNALDFQLVTFMGYLIGSKHSGEYYIVSRDYGFQYALNFCMNYLKNETVLVKRVDTIEQAMELKQTVTSNINSNKEIVGITLDMELEKKEQSNIEQGKIDQQKIDQEKKDQEKKEQEKKEQVKKIPKKKIPKKNETKIGQKKTEQKKTEQEKTEQKKTEQEKTEQEKTEQEKIEQEKTLVEEKVQINKNLIPNIILENQKSKTIENDANTVDKTNLARANDHNVKSESNIKIEESVRSEINSLISKEAHIEKAGSEKVQIEKAGSEKVQIEKAGSEKEQSEKEQIKNEQTESKIEEKIEVQSLNTHSGNEQSEDMLAILRMIISKVYDTSMYDKYGDRTARLFLKSKSKQEFYRSMTKAFGATLGRELYTLIKKEYDHGKAMTV